MSEDKPRDIPDSPDTDKPDTPAPDATPEPEQKPEPELEEKKASKAAAETAPASPRPPGSQKSISLPGIVFYLLLAGGVGVVGYMVYEQGKAVDVLFEQQNGFSAQRDETGNRIDGLQGSIALLQDELGVARQESAALIQEQSVEIERLQNELVSTRLRITENNPGASQEWLLAEAASLLRLAQQQVVMSRNIRTAQALFIAADDVLKQIDDPAIFSVRETLAGELAALRAVPEVDIQGIYLQLGGLAEQVITLRVDNDLAVQLAEGETVEVFDSAQAESAGAVSRFFSRLKSTLNNYLVVRRRDAPIQPLLTPGQEAALMQSILLRIEQGRTALLQGEQEIYSSSLVQARDTIATYLSGNAATRASILDSLDNLAEQRVVTEPPPLNRTRQALEQILSASNTSRANGAGQ